MLLRAGFHFKRCADMKYNIDNVEKLATDIVASWDMEVLVQYAITNLTEHYMANEKEFHEECAEFYDYD